MVLTLMLDVYNTIPIIETMKTMVQWSVLTALALICAARVQAREQATVIAWPGVKADTEAREVVIQAASTGIAPGDPVEFGLLTPASGHDYEALAYGEARAEDVRAALEAIGLPPGRPVDLAKRRFWPKGERVFIEVRWTDVVDGGYEKNVRVPLEQMLLDRRLEGPMAVQGFTFTGSQWVETDDGAVLAADRFSPHAVVSFYNSPLTVLDLPGRGNQNEMYGVFSLNPDYRLEKEHPMEFILRPEYTDDKRRVRNLTWRIQPSGENVSTNWSDMSFALLSQKEQKLNDRDSVAGCLSLFSALQENGQSPYITLDISPALPLGAVARFCRLVQEIEGDRGIRVEPPIEGQLYYQSFLPSPEWKTAEGRFAQPVELHLGEKPGDAEFVKITQTWPASGLTPTREITRHPAAPPAQLLEQAEALDPEVRVLLIFAPTTKRYRDLLAYTDPLKEAFDTVYVFAE